MSPPPFDDEPAGAASGWQPQGSLDASGRLEGGVRRPERRSPDRTDAESSPSREPGSAREEGPRSASGQDAHDAPLELAMRPPRPTSSEQAAQVGPQWRATPPARRPRPWLALALLVGVALAGLTVARVWGRSSATLAALVREPARLLEAPVKGVITITSEPAGATVTIDGRELGTTPWAGDNVWGREVPVELTRRGYRPWRGTLGSGPDVKVRAKLQRGR